MKTREQRRQRRPLGSVFVGQAPHKRSDAFPWGAGHGTLRDTRK